MTQNSNKDQLLEKEITDQRNSLATDKLDMSYGELINLYKNNELIISPKFQRLYRWNISKRTKFIESILLGIPTPPIFVAEDEKGSWELVDGLQRTSTVLSFFGELKNDNPNNSWVMDGGSLVAELNGYSHRTLPEKFKRNILRTPCRVEIIKWDSEYDLRYELFNRLNTGGEPLTQQEIRNCIFRGNSELFNELLNELGTSSAFTELVELTSNQSEQLYNEELVLRFLSLYYTPFKNIDAKNISTFMTSFMETVTENKDFDYENARQIFNKTVNLLSKFTSSIFKFSNNQFSTSLFEAITLGISKNIDYYEKNPQIIDEKILLLKEDTIFKKYTGSAASSKSRVVKRLERALDIFGPRL